MSRVENTRSPTHFLALALALALLCLCPVQLLANAARPPAFASIYNSANDHFAAADYYRPTDTNTTALTFQLAPLILQQVLSKSGSASDRFGAVRFSNGVLAIDSSRPAIYVQTDTVRLEGEPHAQLTYAWFYPSTRRRHKSGGLLCQGVRLTLNSSGQPVIWEILGESAGTRLIFASESLEAAAQARFGAPLSARKYSIEPALSAAPSVVVPRIINDGPVPMGPILYLRARTRSIVTLICRCMPAQAKGIRRSFSYDLLPLDSIPEVALALLHERSQTQCAFWPTPGAPSELEHELRLPSHF